jgi:hypothetical protein
MDTTLTLLSQIISRFSPRIAEIHISELDSWCQHQPMSASAVNDYRMFASRFSSFLPVIIESMLDGNRVGIRMDEFDLARKAMRPLTSEREKESPGGKRKRSSTSRNRFVFHFGKSSASIRVISKKGTRVPSRHQKTPIPTRRKAKI